ncbi:uncharacterized protein LOC111806365 isoform X1 [Cucurbita pepo subsp. pepo]|uniref:uncharacterized protein LOC111806365 isoform X1 n=1 Tax=Cucurbita pepo subsp. pepo TaxID=3664 RepID=UPI000C9D821E|nr:uncharacterized protein LOC111806365 isoform X1 [Cucurbita pepo subsp. pepo]
MALSLSCHAALRLQHQVASGNHSNKNLDNVRRLVNRIGIASVQSSPLESLRDGNWIKLICGASFEDVVDIRNLSLVYTLAGVDCIDCAADASVVSAVNEGIQAARDIVDVRRPWVMISVNDDQDLHFRKAEFDPENCPLDCSRPCEIVCPANAISLREEIMNEPSEVASLSGALKGGVITERCYGCGRCSPVCPYDKINLVTYVRDAATTAELIKRGDVDALEIHTNGRQTTSFQELWDKLGDSSKYLRLVAVSLPNIGDLTISTMKTMFSIMESQLRCSNLWQLDGRPMSGDIGRGATRETIAFAAHLALSNDRPPGFLQLAGGTNFYTVDGLKKQGLFQSTSTRKDLMNKELSSSLHALIGGIAYGGYARKIVGRVLSSMQAQSGDSNIEDYPDHLLAALVEALALVGTVKCYDPSLISSAKANNSLSL